MDEHRRTAARRRGYLPPIGRVPRVWRGLRPPPDGGDDASAGRPRPSAVRAGPVRPNPRPGRRLGDWRLAAAACLDARTSAMMLCDARGRVLHANAALLRILEADPGGSPVGRDMAALAREVSRSMRTAPVAMAARQVRTADGAYVIVATPAGGPGSRVHVTVLLHPVSAADDELRSRYSLTRRELQVARMLALGKRNSAIAAELGMSAHTARRHTERVLHKLGVGSRAGVAQRLGA